MKCWMVIKCYSTAINANPTAIKMKGTAIKFLMAIKRYSTAINIHPRAIKMEGTAIKCWPTVINPITRAIKILLTSIKLQKKKAASNGMPPVIWL